MSQFVKHFAVSTLLFLMLLLGNVRSQAPVSPYSPEHPLDLNNASYEEIAKLPIPQELAERIYYHIEYQGPFTSVYQLTQIPGMTPQLFVRIKPLVRIEPYQPVSEREERIQQLYYYLDRWEGNEGTSQALIDAWIERALEPHYINTIRYDELLNLQGVSPVDAAAIVRYREQVGKISGWRDLRSANYLSYFGYRNARNFISFTPPKVSKAFHGHYLMRIHNTPFLTEEAEATAIIPPESIDNNYPDSYMRLFGSWGRNYKVGISYWHALYEPFMEVGSGGFRVPRFKMYVGIENQHLGPLQIRKVYVGNYALAFAQGVVMDNTDFFLPRKSGFGFRKRFLGLTGDNSRTRQYKLTGLATELALNNHVLFLFTSYDRRDAILNRTPVYENGKPLYPVNQLIVLDQRFQYAPGDQLRENLGLSWRDAVGEWLYGFRYQYEPWLATQVGVTYYESIYDRYLRPDITDIVNPDNTNQIDIVDNEIKFTYGGPVSDGGHVLWKNAKSFRRVYGIDFQTVFRNVAIQFEYGELYKKGGAPIFGTNPKALVASLYFQYNSFNVLALYRNYDVAFDNPYQRSFSNYRRFKRTIFQDYFYLQNPLYGQLYTNNPQPQAEEGFYLYSRYQLNRKMVFTLEYDNWKRKADDASQFRMVGTLEFRPSFPLRISLRQKYQGREVQNTISTEYFENFEFRGTLRARLSRYDELGILYMNALTKFRPRPRLYYPITPGIEYDPVNRGANIASPGEALGGFFTHNFNQWLKLRGFLGFYRGFFWNFEDTQFIVMNSTRGSLRYWISAYSRVSPKISLRLKFTRDYPFPLTNVHARDTNNEEIPPSGGKYFQGNWIQSPQTIYYLEMNYHF